VDASCPVAAKSHIYCEGETIFDAMLNQTNISHNNNKFYIIQMLEEDGGGKQYHVWYRWGRVGAHGQTNLIPFGSNVAGAKNEFCKKFKDKTRNDWNDRECFEHVQGKYDLIQRDYGVDEEEKKEIVEKKSSSQQNDNVPGAKIAAPLQMLISLIFDVKMMSEEMVEIGYDARKMPLGKLTKDTVRKGYQFLKSIAEELLKPRPDEKQLMYLSSRFYTVIPHDFGMRVSFS